VNSPVATVLGISLVPSTITSSIGSLSVFLLNIFSSTKIPLCFISLDTILFFPFDPLTLVFFSFLYILSSFSFTILYSMSSLYFISSIVSKVNFDLGKINFTSLPGFKSVVSISLLAFSKSFTEVSYISAIVAKLSPASILCVFISSPPVLIYSINSFSSEISFGITLVLLISTSSKNLDSFTFLSLSNFFRYDSSILFIISCASSSDFSTPTSSSLTFMAYPSIINSTLSCIALASSCLDDILSSLAYTDSNLRSSSKLALASYSSDTSSLIIFIIEIASSLSLTKPKNSLPI